jgi:hypothetical protein
MPELGHVGGSISLFQERILKTPSIDHSPTLANATDCGSIFLFLYFFYFKIKKKIFAM